MTTNKIITTGIILSVAASFIIPENQIDKNIKPKNEQHIQDTQVAKQGKLQDMSDPNFYENMNIVKSSSSQIKQVKKEEFKVDSTIKVIAQEAKPEAIKKDFITTAIDLGVNNELAKAMEQAGKEYGVDPRYLLTIGLSENALDPTAVGDGGKSYGAYQIYLVAHKATPLHPSIMDCAKDYLCSSRWTANRIKNQYMVNGRGWILGLSHHNSSAGLFPKWYSDKITKNGLLAGLTF